MRILFWLCTGSFFACTENKEKDCGVEDSEEPVVPTLEIVPTADEQAYFDCWLEQDEEFVRSLQWLPHNIHAQG